MEIQNFYSTLYDTKIHNETQTTANLKYVKSKINAEEAKELNKPFTEEEISKATKQMNNKDKDKDKDKDLFIGPQEFFVGYSKAPEQPQSSARPICHSHAMTRTGREPATIRTAA